MAVFWVVEPCNLVKFYKCFIGPCCLQHQYDRHTCCYDYLLILTIYLFTEINRSRWKFRVYYVGLKTNQKSHPIDFIKFKVCIVHTLMALPVSHWFLDSCPPKIRTDIRNQFQFEWNIPFLPLKIREYYISPLQITHATNRFSPKATY